MSRRGVTPDLAKAIMRTNTTAIGAVMVHRTRPTADLRHIRAIPLASELHLPDSRTDDLHPIGALRLMILEDGPLFIADTHVHAEPTPEQIADTYRRRAPRPPFRHRSQSALCSAPNSAISTFQRPPDARRAGDPRRKGCDFDYEGEMTAETALNPELRDRVFPDARLKGQPMC